MGQGTGEGQGGAAQVTTGAPRTVPSAPHSHSLSPSSVLDWAGSQACSSSVLERGKQREESVEEPGKAGRGGGPGDWKAEVEETWAEVSGSELHTPVSVSSLRHTEIRGTGPGQPPQSACTVTLHLYPQEC